MNVLLILNDAPYRSERSFNALRLATALAKRYEVEVRTFLMGDAVGCALADQQTPEGYYNVARLMRGLIAPERRDRVVRARIAPISTRGF